MSTSVLLVGGFGNLGGRIAHHLAENSDCNIVLASRSKREAPTWAKHARVIQLDTTDPSTFINIPQHLDCIIQLAATNDVDSANNPDFARLVTTDGTMALIKEAINRHIGRFLYFSTAHVYGSPLVGDLTELSPTNGTHPYAATHLAAENVVSEFHEKNEIIGINVRLSNSYGRPMEFDSGDWRTLTSDLCRQAVVNKRLEMHTDGQQLRNFVTKTDVVRAVHHLLSLSKDKIGNGVYNLGGSSSQSILSMAKLIQKRAELRYAAAVPLTHPAATSENSSSLNFDIHKLLATGYSLTENADQEIDEFLDMIETHYLK